MYNVFYFFAVFAILYETFVIVRISDCFKFKNSMIGKKSDDYNKTEKTFAQLSLLYALWALVGVFTSQWFAFLALLIVSMLPIKKVKAGMFLDALMSFLILLFIVINKYHLHLKASDIF